MVGGSARERRLEGRAFIMFTLPLSSQALVAGLPIPKDLRKLPNHGLIRMIVGLTTEYRELVPALCKPKGWTAFKGFVAERCQALKIGDLYIRLHENPEYPIRLAFQFSFMKDAQQWLIEFGEENGYGDIVKLDVTEADPERSRALCEAFIEGPLQELCEAIDSVFEDLEQIEIESKHYWEHVHPTLPLEERRRVEDDVRIFACLMFSILHDTISVMAYGETLTSLVQKALAGGEEADGAMCKAVRVNNGLRQHPQFLARYLSATQMSDSEFLRKYDNTTTPLTYKIRYPGIYFLLALLDCFGLLNELTNPQLHDLCDHAKLDRWENRIEDTGYLGKRRNEYLANKYRQLSRHSN